MNDPNGEVDWTFSNMGREFGRACWSADHRYRYVLIRRWDAMRAPLTWIMHNPSTAGADDDDPTVRKCIGYAKRWGYGGIRILNMFALVATNPQELADAPRNRVDPVGPDNDRLLRDWLTPSGDACPPPDVMVAWGTPVRPRGYGGIRDVEVAGILAWAGVKPMCLGTTQAGWPRHPSRTPYDLDRVPWPLT